jgi:hypothetical protein
MRILKQALHSMVLLILALVVVRLAQAPAQVGPQVALGNGDVDCDGEITITDPLVLLNWLFDDGPEPCAIAQEPDPTLAELRQSIDALREEIRNLQPCSLPNPLDAIHLSGEGPESASGFKVFTVPEDKIFVLTELLVNQPPSNAAQGQTEIRERRGATTIVHRPFVGGVYSSAFGIAFQPGSDVVIRIDDTTFGCEPGPCNAKYDLRGYLREP